ncbi:hypothetical protein [Salibacterium sp. K-3]
MDIPVVRAFLMLTVFVLLFFISSVQYGGAGGHFLQIIGFTGMVFALSYGMLLTRDSDRDGQKTEMGDQPYEHG